MCHSMDWSVVFFRKYTTESCRNIQPYPFRVILLALFYRPDFDSASEHSKFFCKMTIYISVISNQWTWKVKADQWMKTILILKSLLANYVTIITIQFITLKHTSAYFPYICWGHVIARLTAKKVFLRLSHLQIVLKQIILETYKNKAS